MPEMMTLVQVHSRISEIRGVRELAERSQLTAALTRSFLVALSEGRVRLIEVSDLALAIETLWRLS